MSDRDLYRTRSDWFPRRTERRTDAYLFQSLLDRYFFFVFMYNYSTSTLCSRDLFICTGKLSVYFRISVLYGRDRELSASEIPKDNIGIVRNNITTDAYACDVP